MDVRPRIVRFGLPLMPFMASSVRFKAQPSYKPAYGVIPLGYRDGERIRH